MHLRQGETDIEQTEMNHANEAKKRDLFKGTVSHVCLCFWDLVIKEENQKESCIPSCELLPVFSGDSMAVNQKLFVAEFTLLRPVRISPPC